MKERIFFWTLLLAAIVWVGLSMRPPSKPAEGFDFHAAGRLPVVHEGRVLPLDTLARNLLRILANEETFRDEHNRRQPAVRWILDVMVDSNDPKRRAQKDRVFRIDHPQLVHQLGLPPREGHRYALEEFHQRIPDLVEQMTKAHELEVKKEPLEAYERQLLDFEKRLRFFISVSRLDLPHLLPPKAAGQEWERFSQRIRHGDRSDPDVESWRRILGAYSDDDPAKFNESVAAYSSRLSRSHPKEIAKSRLESWFNHADLFRTCTWFYLAGLLLAVLSWLGWSRPLIRTSFGLLLLAFLVHTLALVARIYLSGRPPVTNLYSSAIFIGWGGVLLCLVFERFYRYGVAAAVAGILGFGTLVIAPILAADRDTMAVLQAVLDTQFWLATHVVSITLGYATTYIAGFLGIVFILRGVLTRSLTGELRLSLTRMIYGSVCFATFFSFVGTVLGGLWADDSWGRFWGWDPKENGALMIVLWNALVLHARWGGLIRDRGLAVLSVLGNIVVTWSWFGTNLLGVGLHSYGFNDRLFALVVGMAVGNAALAGLGLVPPRAWKSPAPERSRAE